MIDLDLEQPFRTDLEYYEGRAEGIATVGGVSIAEARDDLARRHGFSDWPALLARLEALRDESDPPTPFMLAYRAMEDDDRERLAELLDRHPELVRVRGTNGNDLLDMAGAPGIVRLLLERGADPNRGNDYGWTKLHTAGYSNDPELARLMLGAGGEGHLSARGDGGTPLVAALYRPHGGFPAWEPADDPQEVLDEALVWAAKSDRADVLPLLTELGARADADPYRGTPLAWAAANGRVDAIRRLVELGADSNGRSTFGGPTHRE